MENYQSHSLDNKGYLTCPLCEGSGRTIEINWAYICSCPLCLGKKKIDWVTNIRKGEYNTYEPFI